MIVNASAITSAEPPGITVATREAPSSIWSRPRLRDSKYSNRGLPPAAFRGWRRLRDEQTAFFRVFAGPVERRFLCSRLRGEWRVFVYAAVSAPMGSREKAGGRGNRLRIVEVSFSAAPWPVKFLASPRDESRVHQQYHCPQCPPSSPWRPSSAGARARARPDHGLHTPGRIRSGRRFFVACVPTRSAASLPRVP